MALVGGVGAQQAGVDRIETAVTNYVAQVRTNTTAAVVPALGTGAGLYTYIKITPATNAYIAFGRAATTSDPQIGTTGYTWTLPAGSVHAGGPFRNTAIHLLHTATDASTNLVTVETWKVLPR
jgi:hypothetical protein